MTTLTPSKARRVVALVAVLGALVAGALPAVACSSSDVERGADGCCATATLGGTSVPEIAQASAASDARDDSPCCPGGCNHCSLPCCGGVVYALPLSLLSVAPADVPSDLAALPPPALRSRLTVRDLDRPPRR